MRYPYACTLAATALVGVPATAAELGVTIEIPRLNVAEYHRPYVAMWLEDANQKFAANLAVWYDVKLRNQEGNKWLKDLRQWWRKSGRELSMPADGLSSATRAPGEHRLAFGSAATPLATLPAGRYQLVVEAAREVGGRELLRLPFQWPPTATTTEQARGENELGAVSVRLAP